MSETKTVVLPPSPRSFVPITKVKNLQELWDHPGLKSRMAEILPKHMHADRMLRTLINCTLKVPGLAKVDPLSMLGVSMSLAYLGLEPNTPLQHVHLIPFEVNKWNAATKTREYIRTDATLIIGYQGYIELIARGGQVKDIDCQVVWAGDELEHVHGTNRRFTHIEKHAPRPEGAEPEFAYMHARLTNGGEHVELMSRADIHRVRNLSQGFRTAMNARERNLKEGKNPLYNPAYTEAPWIKHSIAMWRKSALRSGQKWLPKSAELAVAIGMDEAGERGGVKFDQVIDAEHVAGGAWEVPGGDMGDEDIDADGVITTSSKTQVQVSPNVPVTQPATDPVQQARAPAPRKAAAKRAASATDEPPDDDRWGDAQTEQTAPAVARAAAPPITPPVPMGEVAQPAPGDAFPIHASPGGQAFEAWLLDGNGEPVSDDVISDPVEFSRQYARRWEQSHARTTLAEHNADGLADARGASVEAGRILDTLVDAMAAEPDAASTSSVIVVPLAIDRGKPVVGPYLPAFRSAVLGLDAAGFMDFIAANMEILLTVPMSTRSLCLKALVERAAVIGVPVPPSLVQSLNAQPAAKPPESADLPTGADQNYTRDVGHVDNQIEVLKAAEDKNALNRWYNNAQVTSMVNRFKAEIATFREAGNTAEADRKQALYERLGAAYKEKLATFG